MMRMWIVVCVVALLSLPLIPRFETQASAAPPEYVVRRETSSKRCRVQEKTESPVGGDVIKGGFKTKPEATTWMCQNHGAADTSKECMSTVPANACKK